MRVLVTGAAGFIGSHLLPALTSAGHEVYALVRPDQAKRVAKGTVVPVDLRLPLPRRSLPATDAILHLAQANVPFPEGATTLYRVNTMSTQELLEEGRQSGIRRFVLVSSGSVYGFGNRVLSEDAELRANDFYGTTKIHAERLVSLYGDFFAVAILRLFMPYGHGQRRRLIPALISRIENGEPIILNAGGQPHTNPIFVDDVVRLLLKTLERDEHETLNVAGDETVGIREIAERIGEALGVEPRFAEGSTTGPGDLVADNSRLHATMALGQLTSLADGLRRTVVGRAVAEPV